MRKTLQLGLLLALALPFTAQRAEAQFTLMPYLGYNTENAMGFLVGIGGEFNAPFGGALSLSIQPGIEYVFTDVDGFSYLQLDGNVIAKFGAPGASITPYAGAGLGIGFSSVDDCPDELDCSKTDLGLNLLGGVVFPGALGFGDPYVQGRFSMIGGMDALSIMGGLRIPLGAR